MACEQRKAAGLPGLREKAPGLRRRASGPESQAAATARAVTIMTAQTDQMIHIQ